jgi:hypothetical protein
MGMIVSVHSSEGQSIRFITPVNIQWTDSLLMVRQDSGWRCRRMFLCPANIIERKANGWCLAGCVNLGASSHKLLQMEWGDSLPRYLSLSEKGELPVHQNPHWSGWENPWKIEHTPTRFLNRSKGHAGRYWSRCLLKLRNGAGFTCWITWKWNYNRLWRDQRLCGVGLQTRRRLISAVPMDPQDARHDIACLFGWFNVWSFSRSIATRSRPVF